MAWSFGDSFDLYAAPADAANGYWDSGGGAPTFVAGRFSGSQALNFGSISQTLTKSSSVNDTVHHLVVSFQQTAAISGSTLGVFLTLFDGATAQCSVVFRSDGAILLTSGVSTGTVLATYTGAFPVASTWYAFEFEVVINNTTGSFAVRKNGNNVSDFTATSLNTRGGTANNYANKLQIGSGNPTVANDRFDDLFWQSGVATGAWLGDIRCYARMPASDASVTFSKAPTSFLGQNNPSAAVGSSLTANNIRAAPLLAPTTGSLTSLVCQLNAGVTGHVKMALYDSTGASGGAGALLASSVELTNPGAGVNTFTVTGGFSVTRGTTYWVALWSDIAVVFVGGSSLAAGVAAVSGNLQALTYTTTFPSPLVSSSNVAVSAGGCLGMNVTPINAGCVNEPQQDALTSYVFDSTPGDADFYGVAAIASTPATVIATTVRAYAQKSDAGTRTMAVQLKSGATTVASPTLVLTTSGWLWAWRTDTTDPNTGAAWTPAAVNNAQIGPRVIA